jgi:uncharacterized protein YgiB involved in biofilm formation
MKIAGALLLCASLAFAMGCGGGGMSGGGVSGGGITLSLANSSAQVYQGQASVNVNVSLARTGTTGNVTLTVTGLPAGVSDTVQSPGAGTTGGIAFSAETSAAPGDYPLTVTASDGNVSGASSLNLTVGAAAVIAANQTAPFTLAMSTSFQPAEWDYQFFQTNPAATTTLGNLGPHHVRLQGISQGIPQGAEDSPSTAWDFTILDGITQPVLGVGDHSPEFQIAKGPAFMYENNDFNSTFVDQSYAQFAGYAQNLVRYYNTAAGFTANGQTYVSPAFAQGDKVTWWGIYNEPNINNDFAGSPEHPELYVKMYNDVVPAMRAIDPTIKFAAVELADFQGQVQAFIPTFVSGVTAQVDVLATHFYSTCDQTTDDADIFASVATNTDGNFNFVSDVQQIYADLAQNNALKNVPIWVTENNVNADYDAGNGMSACNPGQQFVDDLRGSSAFFAAWRPYVFSQLGKAGVQALYHWDFEADPQFGEVADANGALQLSYWVDYELGHIFPPTSASKLLQYTASDDAELETLPVMNTDGSVVVMVANHAVNSPSDNNGPGAQRSVLIDVSALGSFSTASLLTIDKNTDVSSGPVAAAVTVAAQIPITLNGYSVAFLTLSPTNSGAHR